MKKSILVCNFSGVYEAQGFLQWLQEKGAGIQVMQMADIQGTNCYCDQAAQEEIAKRTAGELPRVRWIDSGDYHYMTFILAKRETQPFHLLLMDNHPDNQEPAFSGVLSCGSWVKAMREENPLLKDILWVGPEGGDYREWINLRRGERLYISLDKDVMAKDWARTDWTQGEYSLEDIENILKEAFDKMDVCALDICGEIAQGKGATPQDRRINFETNIQLYTLINQYVGN